MSPTRAGNVDVDPERRLLLTSFGLFIKLENALCDLQQDVCSSLVLILVDGEDLPWLVRGLMPLLLELQKGSRIMVSSKMVRKLQCKHTLSLPVTFVPSVLGFNFF